MNNPELAADLDDTDPADYGKWLGKHVQQVRDALGGAKPALPEPAPQWSPQLILPNDAPPGTKIWRRPTATGRLSVVLSPPTKLLPQSIVISHEELALVNGKPPTVGRFPSLPELTEIVGRFGQRDHVYALLLVAGLDEALAEPPPVAVIMLQEMPGARAKVPSGASGLVS